MRILVGPAKAIPMSDDGNEDRSRPDERRHEYKKGDREQNARVRGVSDNDPRIDSEGEDTTKGEGDSDSNE